MRKGAHKESMARVLDDLLNDGRLARLFSKDARLAFQPAWRRRDRQRFHHPSRQGGAVPPGSGLQRRLDRIGGQAPKRGRIANEDTMRLRGFCGSL
jgi:hypothetical protein